MPKKQPQQRKDDLLAFVLGGGGARGAMQLGALRVLLENGVLPDLWVGTSVGTVNAAYLALHGFTAQGLDGLSHSWSQAAADDLMPSNYLWLTIRALFDRKDHSADNRFRRFFIKQGLEPQLRFGDLTARVIMVATDLTGGKLALYGIDPEHLVIDGLLASTGLPPWTSMVSRDGHLLMDGGLVCNLPIEPAVTLGATRIVALDLADPRQAGYAFQRLGPLPGQVMNAIEQRQIDLELALAQARGVAVHHIRLLPEKLTPIWDFSHPQALIETGARHMKEYLAGHPELVEPVGRSRWWKFW